MFKQELKTNIANNSNNVDKNKKRAYKKPSIKAALDEELYKQYKIYQKECKLLDYWQEVQDRDPELTHPESKKILANFVNQNEGHYWFEFYDTQCVCHLKDAYMNVQAIAPTPAEAFGKMLEKRCSKNKILRAMQITRKNNPLRMTVGEYTQKLQKTAAL